MGTWDGYEEEVEEILGLGDSVCIVARQRGRGKGSGVEVENRFASLYELEDGLITRIAMYDDVAKALEAADGGDDGPGG